MSFVHLHTHNTHSLLDGYGTPENYVKRAKELGFTALALTNHGNIDGLLKFQKACKKEGIKPILGCEAYLTNNYEAKERANGHIVILVKNATGWATLLRLLTKANLDGFYYKPRIDFKWILSEDLSGLIFLTGCAHSFLTLPGGMEFLKDLKNKATVYLEVMPHNIQEQIEHNRKILEIGKELELSIVASNDSHYILQEQNVAQEVLLAIQSKAKWNDPNRWKFGVSGLHLRTQAEMAIAFNAQGVLTRKEAFEALNRTQEVADMCDFEIPKQNICLPVTRYEKDASAHEVLLRFCKEGKERLFGSKWNQKYEDRLNEEIEVLKNKGFERYFLIVKEILEFCDKNNIMYGPGRGCFSGDTKVSLLDGTEKTFIELVKEYKDESFWVYSCLKDGTIVPGKASNPRITGVVDEVCNITLDNGESITCTTDHQFMTRSGTYRKACDLRIGESLMPLYRKYKRGWEWYKNNSCNRFDLTQYLTFSYKRGYCVHHLNFKKRDNRPENLEQIPKGEHSHIHNKIKWQQKEYREKGIERYWKHLGTKEQRAKKGEQNKDVEFRKKVSEGQKRVWSNPEYKEKMLKKLNSPEIIANRREALIERNKSPEFIKKSIEGRKKFFQTEAGKLERERISARSKGRVTSEETKRKISESRKGKNKNPNNHQVVSIEIINKRTEVYDMEVEEYHNFALTSGVFVHNSVGASIAAYLIGITNVDPLKYDLLFWRFISPDRNDSPDIDLDFSDLHADKIRQHLEDEYGKNNIAGISTFMTMKGRGAVRDVARVFEIPNQDVDTFSKSIEDEKSEDGIIKEALVNTPEGREFYSKYPEVSDYAVTLEGTTRTAGQHPAAVIVSGEDLTTTNKCNLVRRKNNIVANWDMEDSEYNGLMKLDILKLKTLTVLAEAKRLIGGNIEYRDIPLDDPKVFENLSSGNLAGIFQLTGRSCESIIKEVGIDCFDDIPAINALARPGPLVSGLTAEWIKRKKGGEWEKKHPIYEEITKDTLGITCFQENICLIFTQIAGLSPSTADKIRKVIGKKRDPKEFEPFKEEFAAGCKKMGTFSEDEVEEFWAQLLEFASYAFPKAHAVEYGMVGVWTAWIKTYYPTEFFAANLSYGAESSIPALIREIGNTGLRVVTPKAGISDPIRWIAKDGYLYMPFIQIRGIGENKAEKCSKMKKRVIPEGLGFFDDVGGKKSELDTLMEEIKAYDLSPEARPDHPEKYFDFEIEKAEFKKGLIKKARYRNPEASDCIECDLRKQASQVVLPSVGQCNVMILGEAPGSRENEKNQGFIGDSGDLVWGEIAKYGYTRRLFHVSNCVKCYPRYTKTPTKDQVKVCFRWLEDEIQNLQCKLILAMGNTPLLALTGKEGGIVKLNGQTEWLPKLQTWVCWCVHPAMVLRDRNNMEYFREGVKNFIETFEKLKGK